MTVVSRPERIAAAIVVLVLALGSCAASGQAATQHTQAAQSDPSASLLRPDDLPAPFEQVPPEYGDRPVSSTRPECSDTLDAIELDPPTDPAVQEARAFFRDPGGTTVQHVVRIYSQGRAAAEFDSARSTLATCDRFELTYSDGTTAAIEVIPQTAPAYADEAWAVLVQVDVGAFTFASHLTLLRAADRTAAVSVAAPDPPDPSMVNALAMRAAERL